MLPDKDHEITVLAEDPDEARILLSAIVTNMVQSSVRRKHRDVLVSIRDKGEEIAQGAENISAVLRATHSAASYSLLEALRDAKQIPDTLDLTLEAEEQFCGRVGFCCYSPEWESDNTDTVLVIVDQPDVRFLEERLHELLESDRTSLCFALRCGEEPAQGLSQREYLFETYPALRQFTEGRRCGYSWYNPYGYLGGKQRGADNPYPYGIDTLFWETMRVSALTRQQFLNAVIEESLTTIRRRRSKNQKDSVRRMLELDRARLQYAQAVRGLYAASQLEALTGGAPLAEAGNTTKE